MSTETFTAIRGEGGLLPADLLERLSLGLSGRAGAAKDLDGFRAEDYHLAGETLREAATGAWSRLTGVWAAFTDGLGRLPAGDTATSHTRERWLLPLFRALDFGWLERTPAGGLAVPGADPRFPVSHLWRDVPVHLLGWNVPIDRRTPGVAGAASAAPASLVQDLLNRSDAHLWAVVSNGRTLRLLRDSASLVRASYLEFDLEAMFSGELFSEFLLMFALLHQSRFERLGEGEASSPADCWLERWRVAALDRGVRALDLLRDGVVAAIDTLGTGFLRHPDNRALREALRTGELRAEDYQRCLLRLVYRLLFLFAAEDRDALHPAGAEPAARDRYARYFSTARLRQAAGRRFGTAHSDRWHTMRLVFDALGGAHGTGGVPALGLPALGGIFESGALDGPLDGCQLANSDLLAAVRHLSVLPGQHGGPRRRVDYRNLDSEELGSVYESLLEYLPRIDPADRTFRLEKLSGNERKSTGSYYTPASLIECLLDSALDPVLDDAVKSGDTAAEQEAALLAVTVCDPACGSGHFLVAAARRIARRLAVARTGEVEPSPADVRRALHDVAGRCVYGVDINPLAVELARVSLWLEALEPGRPLGFLDAHIRVGNSLLGVTPALLADGLPDAAFKPIEGDDKKVAAALKKQNAKEREGQLDLFDAAGLSLGNAAFGQLAERITSAVPDRLDDVHVQRQRYQRLRDAPGLVRQRQVADAWCAAFVWRKAKDAPTPVTHQTLLDLDADPDRVAWWTREEIDKLAADYRFFHWHLEFPEIFTVPEDGTSSVDERTGWSGGFSCVLGNPPWERVKLQEQEFFAARDEHIAKAPNAATRRKLIAALQTSDSPAERALFTAFGAAKRQAEGVSHLLRDTARFPLTGRGDVNTYAVFAETARVVTGPHGRAGVIVPSGIATDATTQFFFRDLVETKSLAVLYDFENRRPIFPAIDSRIKFSLLTMTGSAERTTIADFAFFLHDIAGLGRADTKLRLTPEEITLLNPNTGTCPVFRSRRDAEITLDIYRRVPVLIRQGDPDGNPWGVSFMRMFDMSNDSHLFHTRDDLERDGWTLRGNVFVRDGERMLPLYEAKMLHHYDHRWATYDDGKAVRDFTLIEKRSMALPLPRYWLPEHDVVNQIGNRWKHGWLWGFRKICRATDERSLITYALPKSGMGDSGNLALAQNTISGCLLFANSTTFVTDYVLRQKLGGTNLNFFYFEQLPFLRQDVYYRPHSWMLQSADAWISSRVLELTYTAWDMAGFARDLGDEGAPFVWDEGRRVLLRAELDAAYFHLYGVGRDDVDYIMDTFPIVRRKDEAAHGEYRTKRLILECYDAMQRAIDTGEPYQTVLDPPPGHGPRHPERTPVGP